MKSGKKSWNATALMGLMPTHPRRSPAYTLTSQKVKKRISNARTKTQSSRRVYACTILTSHALALDLDLTISNVANNNAPKRLHATAVENGPRWKLGLDRLLGVDSGSDEPVLVLNECVFGKLLWKRHTDCMQPRIC